MAVERVAHWPASAKFGSTFDARGVWSSPAANPPPQGSEDMTVIAVIGQMRHISGTIGKCIASSSSSVAGSGGWRLLTQQGSSAGLTFAIADGVGNQRTVGSYVARPGEVLVMVGSHISDVSFGLYVAGRDETAGPYSGYTPNSNGSTLAFGATTSSGSFSIDQTGLIALLATDSAGLDAGGREAAHDLVAANLREGRDLDAGLSAIVAPEHYWDPRDIDWVNGTWEDRIGGTVMNLQGTLERAGFPGRVVGA